MITMTLDHNIDRVAAALAATPAAVLKASSGALKRGSQELTNRMKRRAPKWRSELANSILTAPVGPLEHHVRASKRYATDVEFGSKGGGWAPRSTLEQWIASKGITPRNPNTTTRQLAFLIQRSIAARGSAAQPYARPSLDEVRPIIVQRYTDTLTQLMRGLRA